MNLLTGATGLLGSHVLLHLISKGEHVRALKRTDSDISWIETLSKYYNIDLKKGKLEWVEASLDDMATLNEACKGVNKIIHTAAMVSFNKHHREQLMDVNVIGTRNMVNVALQNQVKRFLYVSSTAAIGGSQASEPITEALQFVEEGNSNYALSKHLAEMEVWRGVEEGLEAVVVNPSIILGAGNWNRSSATIVDTVFKGIPFYPPGANGFVYVWDVVHALFQLEAAGKFNERYLTVGYNLSYQSLFTALANKLKVKAPSYPASKWMLFLAYLAESVQCSFTSKPQRITLETINSATKKVTYSTAKLQEAIDFNFSPIDIVLAELADIYFTTTQD